jgi:hypothetical protein
MAHRHRNTAECLVYWGALEDLKRLEHALTAPVPVEGVSAEVIAVINNWESNPHCGGWIIELKSRLNFIRAALNTATKPDVPQDVDISATVDHEQWCQIKDAITTLALQEIVLQVANHCRQNRPNNHTHGYICGYLEGVHEMENQMLSILKGGQ